VATRSKSVPIRLTRLLQQRPRSPRTAIISKSSRDNISTAPCGTPTTSWLRAPTPASSSPTRRATEWDFLSCVDGPRLARVFLRGCKGGQLRSCVRPVGAARHGRGPWWEPWIEARSLRRGRNAPMTVAGCPRSPDW